jgi:hypothetical protein
VCVFLSIPPFRRSVLTSFTLLGGMMDASHSTLGRSNRGGSCRDSLRASGAGDGAEGTRGERIGVPRTAGLPGRFIALYGRNKFPLGKKRLRCFDEREILTQGGGDGTKISHGRQRVATFFRFFDFGSRPRFCRGPSSPPHYSSLGLASSPYIPSLDHGSRTVYSSRHYGSPGHHCCRGM